MESVRLVSNSKNTHWFDHYEYQKYILFDIYRYLLCLISKTSNYYLKQKTKKKIDFSKISNRSDPLNTFAGSVYVIRARYIWKCKARDHSYVTSKAETHDIAYNSRTLVVNLKTDYPAVWFTVRGMIGHRQVVI